MKYKNKEIGIPTIQQISEYIDSKNFLLSAEEVYERFKSTNWMTKKKTPITSVEAMVAAWNGVVVLRERAIKKKQLEQERREKRRERKKRLKNQPFVPIPYHEQLIDKRWLRFREKVLNHKGRRCERCHSTDHLQIHHLAYKNNHYAWQYGMNDVMVLCQKCHERLHGIDLDREFYNITKY